MTSVAAAIPSVTSAVAVSVGRPFKGRIQPTALKADADEGPSCQKGSEAQYDQDHGPVHSKTLQMVENALTPKCGLIMAAPIGGCA